MKRFELIVGTAIVIAFSTLILSIYTHHQQVIQQEKVELQKSAKKKSLPKSTSKDSGLAGDEIQAATTKSKKGEMNPINWKKSSENKAYPDLDKYPKACLKVSIAKQRVYVMNGKKVLYTMYASTGSHESPTPTGAFKVQAERGDFFYNPTSKEGAKYWVSFKDHGIYLFHTVPTDKNGKFLEDEAEQLGKEAQSHGCVRLAVPDAKWIYEKVPEGMKVEIH
ncbi:L,D-transpeptidase [Pediococcus pentosaceus]|uniref:L,D-transpeptidase n=1 Tax=Pediococcus pentosaceus TaxID=1255 RepID=UPI0018A162A3|nr:L,D-transpeptidase [Pediococcus pentosaceus]MBF7139282.1 L,D-transpeptidase [Pediococcus pentosaceus]